MYNPAGRSFERFVLDDLRQVSAQREPHKCWFLLTRAFGAFGEQLNQVVVEANGHWHTGHGDIVAEVATTAMKRWGSRPLVLRPADVGFSLRAFRSVLFITVRASGFEI